MPSDCEIEREIDCEIIETYAKNKTIIAYELKHGAHLSVVMRRRRTLVMCSVLINFISGIKLL